MDPKAIVEKGDDRIGDEYERRSARPNDPDRECFLRVLLDGLPEGASAPDLWSSIPPTSGHRFSELGLVGAACTHATCNTSLRTIVR